MRKILKIIGIFFFFPLSLFAECEIGAFLGENPPTKQTINEFEDMIGKDIAAVSFYQGMGPVYPPYFPSSFLNENVRYHDGYDTKTVIHVTFEPWVSLDDISRGIYDNYFRSYASQCKDWKDEIRFRFGHEMIHDDNPATDGWYPWQDKPTQYVEAFRHVHDIFEEVGADNVKFVWSPNWLPADFEILKKYYPGKEYVDWIGMDGYNSAGLWNGWVSFDEIFSQLYQTIIQNSEFFGDKPIMLAEFACAEGEEKDEWIEDAFQKIKEEYSKIKAFYWFNIDKERDWRINSSPEALAAFRAAMRDPYFTSHPHGGEGHSGKIKIAVTIPKISMLKVNISRIEGDSWHEDSQINFGTLSYDSHYKIFRATRYYVLDVGVFCNEPSWHITHNTSSITNGLDNLDNNINVVFVKETGGEDSVELGKFSFRNSNGVSFDKKDLDKGWLRIYYGIATGLDDAPGVEPITLAKSAGRYRGKITITLTP